MKSSPVIKPTPPMPRTCDCGFHPEHSVCVKTPIKFKAADNSTSISQHDVCSRRATRRHDASSGWRRHVSRPSRFNPRPRPQAPAGVASLTRATRDRRAVAHMVQPGSLSNTADRRFPLSIYSNLLFCLLIEPYFPPLSCQMTF